MNNKITDKVSSMLNKKHKPNKFMLSLYESNLIDNIRNTNNTKDRLTYAMKLNDLYTKFKK